MALALTVQDPSMVLAIFLPATILVIIATYCTFSALSIVVLKAMRKTAGFTIVRITSSMCPACSTV